MPQHVCSKLRVTECGRCVPLCVIGGWMYLGGVVASRVCAPSECPGIRMSPRILVAIKRRPAVSPSAYGTECRWRLEKAIFWNAGNAVCTGPEATRPPPPAADSSPPSPSVHTRTTPPAPGLSWASPRAQDHVLPSFLQDIPWVSQRWGDLGCSLQLWSPCLSRGAPLPGCTSPREDSHPSPEPGHCARPKRPGQRRAVPPRAGEGAVMKGTVPVLEGILGWAVA